MSSEKSKKKNDGNLVDNAKARKPVKQKKITARETTDSFEDKYIDFKKWLKKTKGPGRFKPQMIHHPAFVPLDHREKSRLEYLQKLKEWEELWDNGREQREKELRDLESPHTEQEWDELMYILKSSVDQILSYQTERKEKEKERKEKEKKEIEEKAKIHALTSAILEKYPWPAEPQRRSKLGKQKLRSPKKHDHKNEIAGRLVGDSEEEAESTVECPECGKVFVILDENGCSIQDFDRCEDLIGEGDDDDLYFNSEFDFISDILLIYEKYINSDDLDYINRLAGVNVSEYCGDWSSFLEQLGIKVISTSWDGGGPCHSGEYSYLIVRRDSQDFLLKKLTVIKKRLEALEELDPLSSQSKTNTPPEQSEKPSPQENLVKELQDRGIKVNVMSKEWLHKRKNDNLKPGEWPKE